MASDGKVIISTELDNSKIPKGITQVKGQLGGLSTVVKKLGVAIAAAFSVRTIVNFSKACLDLGSDLQEVQNVVDVTFTTMNQQVNEFAKNAAKTAGLSETMAKRYAGTFGAMAKSFKFTEAEAYEMSTTLTQLAGDVASFYNLSQDAAYTKLKSVFSGETETLKDLGVVMTQAALDDFAMRKGLKKTTQQMSEQEKVSLRYQFVLEQLSGATGDFVRTSDSWANQTRLLNLQWEQLKATLGQGLINVLTPVVQWLNTVIEKLQDAAEAFKAFTDELFGNASGNTGAVVEGTAEGIGSAADNADQLEANLKAAKKQLVGFDELNIIQNTETKNQNGTEAPGPGAITGGNPEKEAELPTSLKNILQTVKNFSAKMKDALKPSIDAWKDAAESIGPAVEKAAPRIKTAWEKLKSKALAPFAKYLMFDYFPSITNDFSETFAPIFKDTMPAAIEGFTIDFENQCLLIEKACEGLGVAFEGISIAFHDMCESISINWQEYGGSLTQGFIDFKANTWDVWWNLYDTVIAPVLTAWGETIGWLWNEHLKPFWDNLTEFCMSAGESIMIIWNDFLSPVFNWLINTFGPAVSVVLSTIGDAFGILIGVVADVFGGIIDALGGLLTFLSGVFSGNWERAWQGIVDTFSGLFGAIGGIITGVVNVVIGVVNFIIGAIYAVIAGLVNGIGGIAGVIGDVFGQDWHFGMDWNSPPKIPYLAKGAVIPPNKEFLAVLGDQKHGTNIEAPEGLIRSIFQEEMSDAVAGMMSGFEALLEENRALRSVVEGIEVGDTTIGQAANRYNRRLAVMEGGV